MSTFNTQQNNYNDAKYSINTRGISFYNKDGFDPSTLTMGYWNDGLITLKMNPALPKDKQTSGKVYDYEKTVSTALTIQAAEALVYTVNDKLIPAMHKGEDHSVAISVGSDGLVVIGTGVKITGEVRPFIAIHKGVNPTTKIPEMSIFYEFNRIAIIENYDNTTGQYDVTTNNHMEFIAFMSILEHSIKELSKAGVHSIRSVMNAYNTKLMNTVVAIAEKTGASVGGSGYNKGSKIDWNSTSSNSTPNPMDLAEESHIDGLDDLPF